MVWLRILTLEGIIRELTVNELELVSGGRGGRGGGQSQSVNRAGKGNSQNYNQQRNNAFGCGFFSGMAALGAGWGAASGVEGSAGGAALGAGVAALGGIGAGISCGNAFSGGRGR